VELSSKNQEALLHTIVGLSDALRRARITLYSIDPLGTADAGGLRTSYYEQFLKGVKKPSQVQIGNLGLQVLAHQSGGRVLNSSNDVAGEIAKCIVDANAYYVVSFDGPAGDGPSDYHALDMKVDKAGLTARTRSGYYAQPQ
jgi:VWFA-related protein